ncbi:MAG: threonine synthase [Bacteroides sp.]|nr:threonine synthase [Bacteroides sp.]
MKLFRGIRGSMLIFSVIYVLIGLILLVMSDASMLTVSYVFSVLLIITGLILVMYYIGREVTPENESYDLVAGVVAGAAGVYLLIHAKALYPLLPSVMGLLVLLSGVITFQNALDMRRMKQVFWAPVFLISLVSIALGFVILYVPFEKSGNYLRVIGVSMFISGGIDIVTAIWQTVKLHGVGAVTEEVKSAVGKVKQDVTETTNQIKKEVATIKENQYNKALEKTKGNQKKMEVIYSSTRNAGETATASQAILKGLAENGGLFVPNTIPALDVPFEELAKMSYQEVAYVVMSRMLTDFTEEELKYCINSAYDSKFDTPQIAPLKRAHGADYLELFHGSTIAFKDMALSILPYLLTTSAKKNQVKNDIVILTATSGDTGKAALAGFADVPGTKIIVFYPKNGVSPIQEKQMITQKGENTYVVGITGNFDDAQTGVKNMFNDKDLAKEMDGANMQFSSANSINIGRLVPQMVYYVYAYSRLVAQDSIQPGDKINVVVPTGNFGNILAAYYAKEMGLPIGKFICASNENKVLYDFFRTGEYDKNREFILTSSPSMDILISSNLERLIYKLTGNDAEKNAEFMNALNTEGKYTITPEMKEKLSEFFGGYASEAETAATIKKVYEEDQYIMDTHTAVAATVYDKYIAETGDTTPAVIASTASPYKFTRSVMNAIDRAYDSKSDFELIDELNRLSGVAIPQAIEDIRKAPVLHDRVCDKTEMEATVKQLLNIK